MGIKKREKGVKWLGAVRGRHVSDVDQNRYNARSFSRWSLSFEMYFSVHRFIDKNTMHCCMHRCPFYFFFFFFFVEMYVRSCNRYYILFLVKV